MLSRLSRLSAGLIGAATLGAAPLAQHVVVIGLDGCRPELLRDHAEGALREAWQEGAYTWKAQAVTPSVTQCNFASILTSCRPEKHGIDQVKWDESISPKLKVRVKSVFTILSEENRTAAAFLGHEKLYPVELPLPGIHFEHSPWSAKEAAPMAANYLREHRPVFIFIYFGDLDGAGHRSGWMSAEQIATMHEINRGVDIIFDAIRETSLRNHTIVIITADHGGHGKSHSAGTTEDVTIPWICWGQGVRRGELREPVRNYDTAATALYVLGIPAPREWDGHAVCTAFAETIKPSPIQ